METVTLYADDFRMIHNTLCNLRSVQQRLTGVINNELADQLHSVVMGFEAGLKNAYEQENRAFETKGDYYESFRKDHGLKSIWSIYELPQHGFLAEHPYQGATEVVYGDHWGDREISVAVLGPTWADLYRAADQAIRESGDQHHIFIERFYPVKGTKSLKLATGS